MGKIIRKEFTYREFVEKSKSNAERAKKRNGDEYTGGFTYKKAVKTAINGWDAGIKQLDLDLGVRNENGISFKQEVAGGYVNIQNYLIGTPETMWQVESVEDYNKEPLTIFCRTSYRGGVKGGFALQYCSGVVELVNKLNAFYNLKVVAVFDGEFGDRRLCEHIIIKDYDDRFVLNKIAFAFHPAFFRCIRWGYLDGTKYGKGYGSTVLQSDFIDRIKKQDVINSERIICTPSVDELNEVQESGWFSFNHCETFNIDKEEKTEINKLYEVNKNE